MKKFLFFPKAKSVPETR